MTGSAHFSLARSLGDDGPVCRAATSGGDGLAMSLRFDADSDDDIRIQVMEEGEQFRLSARLPVVDWDALTVCVGDGHVSISARTNAGTHDGRGDGAAGHGFLREHHWEFSLPWAVDDFRAAVKFEDGALELVLPKTHAAARPEFAPA